MKSNKLFDLIKSLDKNEKGYFKKQLFKLSVGDNRYFIILFNHMNAQSTYNEKLIKQKIKDEKILKNFTALKIYLCDAILKMLSSYHADVSSKSQIKNMIRNAEILILKALYKDARNTLVRALKLAQQQEFFLLIVEIYELLLKIDQASFQSGDETQKWLNILIESRGESIINIKKYTNILEYWDILLGYNQIDLSKERTSEKQKKLIDIVKNSYLTDDKNALSVHAKIRHYTLKGIINMNYLDNAEEGMNAFRKNCQLYETYQKTKLKDDLRGYIASLHNAMSCANVLRDGNAFDFFCSKMTRLSTKHPLYKMYISRYITINKLYYFIRHNKLVEGVDYIKTIEMERESNQLPLNHITHMMFVYTSILYLLNAQPKLALSYIRKLFSSESAKNIDEELICFSLYLWLIIEYESGDFVYLDYCLEIIGRKIKALQCDKFIAQQCISFVKSVNRQTDRKKIRIALKKLEQSVRQYPKFNTIENYLFSVSNWAREKLLT